VTRKAWLTAVGLLLIVGGLLLPRDWYDDLPRARGAPPAPVKGVTLLQSSIVADGLLLLWVASRQRVFTRIPETERLQLDAPPPEPVAPRLTRAAAVWLVVAITGVGLILRLWRLGSDLWLDEITPIYDYGELSYLQVIATYAASNNHLLNTLLMKLSVAAFGEREWAIRLPAVILGTATIPIFYRVARLASTRVVSVSAALLLAVSYHHIFFSQNARGYTGHVLFSLAATGLFVRGLKDDRLSVWASYIAATVLNIAVLLHGAFVLTAHALLSCGVIAYRWRSGQPPKALIARVVAVFGLAGFLVFQLYATALPQVFVYITTTYAQPGSGYAGLSMEFAREVARGLAQALPPILLVLAVPAMLIGAFGWVVVLRHNWLSMTSLTLPLVLMAVTLLAGGLTFSPRFFLLALPIGLLCGVEGLYTIPLLMRERHRMKLMVTATALVVAGAVASLVPLGHYYATPKQPYRDAIAYVEQQRGEGGIVIAIHLVEVGYRYYANRRGLEENRDFFLVRSTDALDAVLSAHASRPAYLVTTFPRFLHLHSPELEQRIAADWVATRTFPATMGDGAITVWKPAAAPVR